MGSFKERERQRREHEILCAAGRFIAERGYAALTMDDLADAIGISKPTLYQHFKSKDDLIAHVIIHAFDTLESYLDSIPAGTPIERLESVIRFLVEQRYARDSVLSSLGPQVVLSTVCTSVAFSEHKARMMTRLQALVDDAKTKGQIDSTIPSVIIVRTLFCLLGVLPEQPAQADLCNLNDALEGTIRLFIRGVIPATGS